MLGSGSKISINVGRYLLASILFASIVIYPMVGVAAEGSAIEAHGVTFDQIQFQVFSFVTYLLACILLIRTFTGKDQSRFLIHAATAFGIICFDHLLSGGIESIK